jgi:hypothetical protein
MFIIRNSLSALFDLKASPLAKAYIGLLKIVDKITASRKAFG